MSTLLVVIFVALFLFVLFEVAHIGRHLAISKRLTKSVEIYRRHLPEARRRVLFVGDSTGYGTGTSHSQYSLMGRFAQDVPELHIENYSRTGQKLGGVARTLQARLAAGGAPVDLVIIMAGGMNAVHLTPLWLQRRLLTRVLELSKHCGARTLLIAPYNGGLAPLYHFPLGAIFQRRLGATARLFERVAHEEGVYFASLFEKDADLLSSRRLYALDKVHPNDEGYALWYDHLRPALMGALDIAS